MRRPSGFTLLEVMIATVLTGVVALMAFASARVSVEAGGVLDRELGALRSDRATHQTLLDLLHNVRPPRARGDTSLALRHDTLTFSAAGATPLDPERDWQVTVRPGPAGLELEARTLGRGPVLVRLLRMPRITRWEVRVLPPRGREWLEEWAPAPVLPSAVAVTLWRDGTPIGPPSTIALSGAVATMAESDNPME